MNIFLTILVIIALALLVAIIINSFENNKGDEK